MQRCVLIVTQVYPPSAAIGAFRPARFAKYLPEFGWRAVVATSEDDAMLVDRDDSRMQWVNQETVVDRTAPWRLPAFMRRRWRASFGQSTAPPATTPRNPGPAIPARSSFRSRINALKSAALLPFRIPDKHIWWAVRHQSAA
jgi:hypothetical protein